jgi:hypothetical protein
MKSGQSDEALERFAGENANEEVFMRYKPSEKILLDESNPGGGVRKTLPEYEANTSYTSNNRGNTGEILDSMDGVTEEVVEDAMEEALKPGFNQGGRAGYAAGKGVTSLLNLIKKKFGKDSITTADKIPTPRATLDRDMFKKFDDRNPDQNRLLTNEEIEDYEMELGDSETWMMDGTVGEAEEALIEQKRYMADMELEYKKGNLDPVAGEKSPARKRFLEKKLEEMEASGDSRLMTREEIEELTFFDLGTEMDKTKLSVNDEIKQGVADVMSDTSPEGLAKSIEIDNLMLKYEGMDKNLADQIASSSPTMKADMIAMVEQSLKMDEMGMSADDIIQTFKNTTRKKQATGGRIGLLSGGGVLKKLIMNLAKEKGMSGSEVLKVMNYKSLPSKIKNLMTKEEFDRMKANRLEGVEIWKDLMSSQQDLVKNVEAGKNTPAAGLFEELEKTSPGYGTVPRNISDADILQMEQMIKNMKTKDNRQLNATGGLANLLGE